MKLDDTWASHEASWMRSQRRRQREARRLRVMLWSLGVIGLVVAFEIWALWPLTTR